MSALTRLRYSYQLHNRLVGCRYITIIRLGLHNVIDYVLVDHILLECTNRSVIVVTQYTESTVQDLNYPTAY